MRWVALLVVICACYKEHTFHDCELSCTNEVGCPSGLACLDGMCRESGQTGTCSMHTGDGMVDGPNDGSAGSGSDADADSIPDSVDNCPTKANRDQNDEDRDTIGDVCDVCPISTNNTDTDHDGVGDDCDPDNTVTNRIVLFEGFKTAPVGGMPMGPGTWSFGNGVATADSGFNNAYLWSLTGTGQAAVYTSVTINASNGTPYYAGTIMGADSTTQGGGACANYTTASGGSVFAIVNVTTNAPMNQAPGSVYSLGQDYPMSQIALNNTFKCTRGPQFQVSGSPQVNGAMVGLIASSANATFDYVMVVAQ